MVVTRDMSPARSARIAARIREGREAAEPEAKSAKPQPAVRPAWGRAQAGPDLVAPPVKARRPRHF